MPLLQKLSCGLCFKQQTDSQIQIYFHTIFFWLKIALESKSKLRPMFAFSYFICAVHHHLHQGLKIPCSSQSVSCFWRQIASRWFMWQMEPAEDRVWCTAGLPRAVSHSGAQEDAGCLVLLAGGPCPHSGALSHWGGSYSLCLVLHWAPPWKAKTSFLCVAMQSRRLTTTLY